MDVETVFLNADLDTEVYMKTSPEMEDLVRKFLESQHLDLNDDLDEREPVLQLLKSLYSLKQAPRE